MCDDLIYKLLGLTLKRPFSIFDDIIYKLYGLNIKSPFYPILMSQFIFQLD